MGSHPVRPSVGRDRGGDLRSALARWGSRCTTRRCSHIWSSWTPAFRHRGGCSWPTVDADAATSYSVGPETHRHLCPGPPSHLWGRDLDRVRVVDPDEPL